MRTCVVKPTWLQLELLTLILRVNAAFSGSRPLPLSTYARGFYKPPFNRSSISLVQAGEPATKLDSQTLEQLLFLIFGDKLPISNNAIQPRTDVVKLLQSVGNVESYTWRDIDMLEVRFKCRESRHRNGRHFSRTQTALAWGRRDWPRTVTNGEVQTRGTIIRVQDCQTYKTPQEYAIWKHAKFWIVVDEFRLHVHGSKMCF